MRVLLVGSGAREHAIAYKFSQSSLLTSLFAWPGSSSIQQFAKTCSVDANASLHDLAKWCRNEMIELVFVGPEKYLAEGIADILTENNICVFGPSRAAAQLESSKAFAKEIMHRSLIPTAEFTLCHSESECRQAAYRMIEKKGAAVIKASGLAQGKGVFVCHLLIEVDEALNKLFDTPMKKSADLVVVEEKLIGRECSYFVFLGNNQFTELGFAVDYKRLQDGDHGPNTGGMGSYSPVSWLPQNANEIIQKKVTEPLIQSLRKEQIEYSGCLYIGIMWTERGPFVLEYNVRLGDPEAQVLATSSDKDWLAAAAFHAGVKKISEHDLNRKVFASPSSVAIVMAAKGYPFGETLENPTHLNSDVLKIEKHSQVFGASLQESSIGGFKTGQGRVLTVVGRGNNISESRQNAYQRVYDITSHWSSAIWRKDIAAHFS